MHPYSRIHKELVMQNYKNILAEVLNYNTLSDGSLLTRKTRSGEVVSAPNFKLEWNLQNGFPAVTIKQLHYKGVVGELLWMLSGKTDLDSLCYYSGKEEGSHTIWTDDAERWGGRGNKQLGAIYGEQWRNFGEVVDDYEYIVQKGVDQIINLIEGLKSDPYSRYHLVSAWNPNVRQDGKIALPSCHYAFQCYVDEDEHGYRYLDLHWNQRSCDLSLGLPFNIASYATLLVILAKLCGYMPRILSCHIMDAHIYRNQLPMVWEMLDREPKPLCGLKIPRFKSLDELVENFTAKDFHLINYEHCGKLVIPLSVGQE